ncbi:MAG: helix-turn-helix transcriptional regulator [Proteobacteria bacterium]|nr:helix-turn-helix transcriptional regulator [Pseudomonadota bacterium]
MARSVQFNVRIKEEVAASLRGEAKARGILPGELLEELEMGHRAQTRAGVWVELGDRVDAALRAVAGMRQTSPELLLRDIVGNAAREMLLDLVADLPTLDLGDDGYDDLLDLFDDDYAAAAPPQRRSESALPHGDRRRRPRRTTLSDAERAELAALSDSVPRTGAALRSWRKQKRLSDTALGQRCGVSKVAIGLWENKTELPAPILLKLARGIADLLEP